MDLEKSLEIYNNTTKILKALEYVDYLNSWDIQTEAPVDSIEEKNKQMEFFCDYEYNVKTAKDYIDAVNVLFENKDKLDEVLSHEVTRIKTEIDKVKKIPKIEFINYNSLINSAYNYFVEAKNNNNFELVKPYLEKIIEFKKKYIVWQGNKGYDTLLDEYEQESTVELYDKFFELIKLKLIPLIKKINKKTLNYNTEIFNQKFSVEKQKQFEQYIKDVLCLDNNKFVIKESEHPFTTNFSNKDVRITNHYFEHILKSAMFSAIHEMGHALYELQVDDKLNETLSGGGSSMAMHESQSRFMENLIGKDYDFWSTHFCKLKEIFKEELKDCTIQDFYKYINEVKSDYIRTEADELTYPIHILIRYEIEKGIFENKYTVEELPKIWKKYYKEYLDIDVPNDSMGILQDVHWYVGDFGYFPTYALGTAYACQFFNTIKKEINVANVLRGKDIKTITEWLKNNIHKYGNSKNPSEILFLATKEKFEPKYYIDYLCLKFSKIYNIDD